MRDFCPMSAVPICSLRACKEGGDEYGLRPLARELAARINKLVNIPFVNEEQEQYFFEMIVVLVLEILLKHIAPTLGRDG